MRINKLKRKRHLIYETDLVDQRPGNPVFECEEYEAFKLRIKRRDTGDAWGETNFLIRSRTNNLRYLLVYCFTREPGQVFRICFWINDKVLLPDGELATAGKLLDEEKASYFVLDFIEQYIKKNYTFVSENVQQN